MTTYPYSFKDNILYKYGVSIGALSRGNIIYNIEVHTSPYPSDDTKYIRCWYGNPDRAKVYHTFRG